MFSDVAALHSAILAKEPKSFVSHHLFEPVPFAFGGDSEAWIEWKETLGGLIDVDPQNIVMTGSAAIGFSLNPRKRFKPFDTTSDFDCGIISDYYFDVAWRYLRQRRVAWLTLSRRNREAIDKHRKNYVFAGTIAADSMLALLPFGATWQRALDQMARIDPSKGRAVKLRIYKDFDCLRHYHASNVENLRDRIGGEPDPEISADEDTTDIPLEGDNEPR